MLRSGRAMAAPWLRPRGALVAVLAIGTPPAFQGRRSKIGAALALERVLAALTAFGALWLRYACAFVAQRPRFGCALAARQLLPGRALALLQPRSAAALPRESVVIFLWD